VVTEMSGENAAPERREGVFFDKEKKKGGELADKKKRRVVPAMWQDVKSFFIQKHSGGERGKGPQGRRKSKLQARLEERASNTMRGGEIPGP